MLAWSLLALTPGAMLTWASSLNFFDPSVFAHRQTEWQEGQQQPLARSLTESETFRARWLPWIPSWNLFAALTLVWMFPVFMCTCESACVCVCLWVCFESLKSPNYEKQRCRDIEYIHTQHPGWAVIVLFHCDDDITVSALNQPSKCMWNQIWMCSCRPHFCWFHLVNDQGQMMIYYYNTKNIPNIVIFNCLYIVVTRRTFQFFHHPPLLQHLCLYNGVLVGVLTVLVIQLHPTPTISSGSTLWHFLLRD